MKIMKALGDAVKKSWRLVLATSLATYLIAMLVSFFQVPTLTVTASVVDIRQQVLSQGAAPQIGEYLVSLFQGILPWTLPAAIGLLIGAYVFITIGLAVVYAMPKLAVGFGILKSDKTKKIASALLYGSLIATIVLGLATGIGIPATLLAMALYYLGITAVLTLVMKVKVVDNLVTI